MPDFSVSPISIVNQIKSNLQDRYESGFPILKELLQNADDSEARRIRLEALPGWPAASNPLMQGPGLLVVNDGIFRKEDERGITSFGESSKASDSAAIGKFGFGQKAVFHLCDAFLVYAYGENNTFSTVVNPFLDVEVDGNISQTWEPPSNGEIPEADCQLLSNAVTPDYQDRCLILWLPFRRKDLRPAPDVGFSSNFPSPSATIAELARPSDLRVLLTAMRHLEFIEICESGTAVCAVEVNEARGRLLGPDKWQSGIRKFGGATKSSVDQSTCEFVAREVATLDDRLAQLQRTFHWPTIIDVRSPKPKPEKGQPHGAATLLRDSACDDSNLRISWAVFLPISEDSDVNIRINSATLGELRLLLHGYFFLDSGRRMIEGLTKPSHDDEPNDASSLREAWNTELRDSVVLPLVPSVLRDTLDSKMISSAELLELVRSVAQDDWFKDHRRSICREHSLGRILEESSGPVWRIVPRGTDLRPLPGIVEDAPGRIEELFPSIHTWANSSDALLLVDQNAALLSESIRWEADDFGALFAGLSPRAFQSRGLAKLLAEFLFSAEPGEAERGAIGQHLVSALRRAMLEAAPLANAELIKSILEYVPHGSLLPLPPSVENRQLFRSLAATRCDVLPVRQEWMDEPFRCPQLSNPNLKVLLEALQTHIEGDNSDQAAIAALSLLGHAERDLPSLANDPDVGPLKVLRARDVRASRPVALSLEALVEHSRSKVLFAASVEANRLLPSLAAALPDEDLFLVEGSAAQFLRESGGSTLLLHAARKDAAFELINKAFCFGSEHARLQLLARLGADIGDDRTALRRLCAGDRTAGSSDSKLWMLERTVSGIERIIAGIINQRENEFLVPASLVDELKIKTRDHIGIDVLGTANLEVFLSDSVAEVEKLTPTTVEQEVLLRTELSDSLLCRLPIHTRVDGDSGNAFGVFRLTPDWPVPASLQSIVPIIKPCSDPKAKKRQDHLIPTWSPDTQLETAIAQPEPHCLRGEILNALANVQDRGDLESLVSNIQKTPWLFADGRPIAPEDILTLPPNVYEAAKRILIKDGYTPPFMPAQKLAIDIREDIGFEKLKEWILPDQDGSLVTLALMIEDQKIIGRLGPPDKYPVDELITLARDGSDLRLPGWPLLSAVLTSVGDQRDIALAIVAAFVELGESNAKLTAGHLDSLAALAEEKGGKGEAARRSYLSGFSIIANWSEEARCDVFSDSRVPTEGGQWRSGREVIESGEGVEPNHVLAGECASLLRVNDQESVHVPDVEVSPVDRASPKLQRGEVKELNLADLDVKSAEQQRTFLKAWRGRVPSDLVIVYLGLVGRSAPFRQLANEWLADATSDVDTLWADLDNHFPSQILYPGPLSEEVEQRRFLIEQIKAESVQAVALSGDLFNAPLGGAQDSLILGNLHKSPDGTRAGDGRVRSLVTLPVKQVDPSKYGQREACRILRQFIETVASDCLWLGMANQQSALKDILDKAVDVDQSTLEETERLLRDRLPTILAELKLPIEYRAQKALRIYQNKEGHLHRLSASAQDIQQLKAELWSSIIDPEIADELLVAVRSKIQDFGYSASRVLFELFQNADDAYRQLGGTNRDACLRVEMLTEGPGGIRVTHWGRPINHLGPDATEGRRLGHDRDLLNMLLMNFSEKRSGEDLTGKFGLGFKSVHVLSDHVGIASGFISLRTLGGFVPGAWPEGIDVSEALKRSDGRKSTVIDVPYSASTLEDGEEAVKSFRASAAWMPAFARAIRQIEILDEDPLNIDCSSAPLFDESEIKVVTISGTRSEQGLRFDLCDGYSLLLMVDAAGPCAFPKELRRLWNLAPLEEDLRSGWLLNGPFAVDPGRGRLAGSIVNRQGIFQRLGGSLGDQLKELYRLAESGWSNLAGPLNLDESENDAKALFYSRLFQLFQLDFDDDLARYLHADGRGYGQLAAECQVVPTHLPQPFDAPVCASDVDHFTDAALSESDILEKVRDWQALANLEGKTVASEVAGQLVKLGFSGMHSIKVADLLRREMGTEGRIDVQLAEKLGRLLTVEAIEQEPLAQERKQILDAAKQVNVLAEDGSWRSVRDINSEYAGSEDEKLLCYFAPPGALLSKGYQGTALEFFKVARSQSGYGPQAPLLLNWAKKADSVDRKRAVLWYVIEGRQGRAVAEAMRSDSPAWVPQPLERLLEDPLLAGWSDEDRKRLLFELGGHYLFNVITGDPTKDQPMADPQSVLSNIYDWWLAEGATERDEYTKSVYPTFFLPSELCEGSNRTAWFTMFALACFQSFGRTQDVQHRSFIERGWNEGWWRELADSRPPNDIQSWLDRLEGWSAPEHFDQNFLPWRRTFVDLYTVARWLDEYIELLIKLPRIAQDRGPISLNDILRPSYSPMIMPLGLDAAPLSRSLGIGMNWMIREMLRQGVYGQHDCKSLAPYCWAPSQRVRELLNAIGADVGVWADKEASRAIHEFIVEHIGDDRARFNGDFDLPLQLITREIHREALNHCFELTDHDPPVFGEAEEDVEDALEFEVTVDDRH